MNLPATVKDTAPGVGASRIFVLVHLACCGVPLLIVLAALGPFGMIGALLADPLTAAAAIGLSVLAGVVGVALVVRRRGSAAGAGCDCSLVPHRPGQLPFSENPVHVGIRGAGTEPMRSNDDGTRSVSGVRF